MPSVEKLFFTSIALRSDLVCLLEIVDVNSGEIVGEDRKGEEDIGG